MRPFLLRLKQAMTGAFIAPWRDHARAKILAIGIIANLGFGCLSFTLNYAMAGYGYEASLIYQILRMFFTGYVFVPQTFWLLARYKSRWLLLAVQLACTSVLFINPSWSALNALAAAATLAPFLALNEYGFSKNQSRANRGNETALHTYLVTFSYSLGLFIGGFLLQHNLYYPACVGGCLCTIISAFFLYVPVGGRNNLKKVWGLIGKDKPSTRISFFFGLFNPMVDGIMPIWMRVLGISAIGAGINMSLRPILGLFLTPVAGWLIQKKGMQAGQLGGIAMIIGWTFLAVAVNHPWLFAIGLSVLTVATNLLKPWKSTAGSNADPPPGLSAAKLLLPQDACRPTFWGLRPLSSFLWLTQFWGLGSALCSCLAYVRNERAFSGA
ncbi:MAG: hypothetical protein AB7E52_03820 [Bdellovibrionales bacterium]